MPRSSGSERQSYIPVAPSPNGATADDRVRTADVDERVLPAAESTRDVAHEDFLFHLYRGGELLQENRVVEAKEELEFALTMQPLDAKGQDLLAAVYFRLGLYPRAIQIYEALAAQFDRDVSIKTNLALAYLKTGQPDLASPVLKEAVRLNPNHKKAWGYLGLAHQKLGELAQAEVAFERGGHTVMAQKATAKRKSMVPPTPVPPARVDPDVRDVAETAFLELDAGELRFALAEPESHAALEGTWHTLELGEPAADRRAAGRTVPMPSPFDAMELAPSPAPPQEGEAPHPGEDETAAPVRFGDESLDEESDAYAATRLVPPPLTHVPTPPPPNPARLRGAPSLFTLATDATIGLAAGGLLLVRTGAEPTRAFAGRLDAIRAIGGAAMTRVLHRRTRDNETAEVLGGIGSPLVRIAGEGELVMGPRPAHELGLFALEEDLAFLREDCLLGFELALSYENGRVPLDSASESGRPSAEGTAIVQLRGTGTFVVEVVGTLSSLPCTPGRPLIVRREWVVGWFGRLVTRALPAASSPTGQRGLVSFAGEGLVLLCCG